MTVARAALVALAVAAVAPGTAGCECRKARQAEPRDERAAPERQRPTGERRPERGPSRRGPRELPPRQLAPITLDDAAAALPALEHRTMTPPAVAPSGNLARFSYCLEADGVEAAGRTLAAAFEADGWRVTPRPPAADGPARFGIAGAKGDHRVSITVMGVRRTGCDETVGQYFAVASVTRVAAPPAPPPPAP